MNRSQLSKLIKSEALKRGFSYCGIAKARKLDEHEPRLTDWLEKGMNGSMQYMENHFEKRLDPRLLIDGAKTVVSLMMDYFPENPSLNSGLKISKYAWNIDYHLVIRQRLFEMVGSLREATGDFNYRVFVDSAPLLDRAWAVEAGIGWIGKNSMLISRKTGSFYFLAEIVCDLEPEYDLPFGGSYCGDCSRCIDSCPTGAIMDNRTIDANKCISYLTIELKDEIDSSFKDKLNDWIFGCDICQDVCPWNKFSIPHSVQEFTPKGEWTEWTADDWQLMDKPLFNELFRNSAVKRAGFGKLKNTINFVTLKKE
ncbi:MAG TPA: tRNA epoxyqueuosine(34) reductase QueG [Lentimicrobium sp.]|nr:tRNA epoxyqueuosine(34) reductase QueG [Lentimicrobium sp.]